MKHTRKVLAIALLVAVIGIVTGGPAMADKNSAPGQNKIDMCHYDKEDGEYKKKTIPQKAADRHLENHENDLILAAEEECPETEDEESESGDTMDMDMLLGMFTQIVTFDEEVDNLQTQIDDINGGENENFKFGHLIDEAGSQWNPNDSQRHFDITDEAINSHSVVSVTIFNPSGADSKNPECDGHIIENADGTYLLGIDCVTWVPEGTILNYVIMNPTI